MNGETETPGVRTVAVVSTEAGLRLDRWFKRHFPQVPHALLEKWLRTGQVRLDGKRVTAGARVEAGQSVRVPPAPAALPRLPAASRPAPPSQAEASALRQAVLYRDDDMIILDKPAGLAVQGGTGMTTHLDGMLDVLAAGGERPRLVHRLDKDTSGVLVLARTAANAAALGQAFRGREVRKLYWALVVGVPPAAEGEIRAPLAKEDRAGSERVGVDAAAGVPAVTRYRVLERIGRRAAWLELEPETGRTHQLRVHCQVLGTPILGDGKYGGRAAFLSEAGIGRRLHLHARAIAVALPAKPLIAIAAPLPAHMRQTWAFLGLPIETERQTLERWPRTGQKR
jgi:23S rRNA pseudouridine955/2504/2580 synthase